MKTLTNYPDSASPTPALPRSAELATKPIVGEGKGGGNFRSGRLAQGTV